MGFCKFERHTLRQLTTGTNVSVLMRLVQDNKDSFVGKDEKENDEEDLEEGSYSTVLSSVGLQ